ncbi:MAG: helix-turn-helix transcriptional regulator [Catenulispora sp.]|nr:helix-turn-helix transcriptional regulator [Catenulispora sp.]
MRTYGHYCSLARALDVVGDRWTLLIARELLVHGPRRFTDLKNGLPGIAPNLLSTRLRELEEAGLITREDAPPPVATTLYRLTEDGLALEPALKTLGLWGLRYMGTERADDSFHMQWLAIAPEWFSTDADPSGSPATIEVMAAGEHAVIELGGGRIHSRVGRAVDPDLTLQGSPRTVLGLLTGVMDLHRATELGLVAHGRLDLLQRIKPVMATPQADAR